MNLNTFEQTLVIYGAQLRRWPVALQAPGKTLLAGEGEMATKAQVLLRQAGEFDKLIFTASTPVDAADAAALADFIWACPEVQVQPRKPMHHWLSLCRRRWLQIRLRVRLLGRPVLRASTGEFPAGGFARRAFNVRHPLLGPSTLALGAVAAGCVLGLQVPDWLSLPGLASPSASKVNAITLIFSV